MSAYRRPAPAAARLLSGASTAALVLAGTLALPAAAHAQTAPAPFQGMIEMAAGKIMLPDGTMSQWTGADRPMVGTAADGRPIMTIQQQQQKALLDWERFQLQTDEILEFQQASRDWIAVNRVHGADAAKIDGEIRAPGRVFVFNDNGVLLGKDAKINVRQLVTGAGINDVNVDGATTTLVQSREKAIANWSDFSSQAGEVLRITQEKKDWVMLNRSMKTGTTRVDGSVKADGHVYLVAPEGLEVNGAIDAQQVILSSLNIRDQQFYAGIAAPGQSDSVRLEPAFSNTWRYPDRPVYENWGAYLLSIDDVPPDLIDENDPTRFNLTVGRNAVINGGAMGKVMLFGPQVTNRGTINVRDEGQVILAAGENIYFDVNGHSNGMINVHTGSFNPMTGGRANIPYATPLWMGPDGNLQSGWKVYDAEWQAFYEAILGRPFAIGYELTYDEQTELKGSWDRAGKIVQFLDRRYTERTREMNYTASNQGIINALRGGEVTFRGLHLEQMGAISMTSTARFRANIDFFTLIEDYGSNYASSGSADGMFVDGHGVVTFGKGSLTQITPDLESTDTLPVTSSAQSVGTLKVNAAQLHMEEDSLVYLPSGLFDVLLDDGGKIFGNNRGVTGNTNTESGTRFLMDRGATIDLSGWSSTVLPMGYHQVRGKLFAAQLSDSPLQREGPLYRKEIFVDRRYGTDFANWQSFDNLNQGTLAQFLINGGTFQIDVDDDFIMKPGSIIDVSGGQITYDAGYVYTTLLRTLDNRIIDIREASPDELYMGLANEWVQYDTKWGQSKTYYIPLMSSVVGRYEESYVHGGAGGNIDILAPDVLLQGSFKGDVVAGKFQRTNIPAGGSFTLGDAGPDEGEYRSNTVLITAVEKAISDSFGMKSKLSDEFGDLFGEEYEEGDPDDRTFDNTTLIAQAFFDRSTMGSYFIAQQNKLGTNTSHPEAAADAGILVESGVNLNLVNGGSLTLQSFESSDVVRFAGNFSSQGGSLRIGGRGIDFAPDVRISTRGAWVNEYEIASATSSDALLRLNAGSIALNVQTGARDDDPTGYLYLPDTVQFDLTGGGWLDKSGNLTGGKGGNFTLGVSGSRITSVVMDGIMNIDALGLGGNGAFTLTSVTDLILGGTSVEGETATRLGSSFFENSGFSKVSLTAPTVTVEAGTEIRATAALLQLAPGEGGAVAPAYLAPTGSDIRDFAEFVSLPVELRPAGRQSGMELALAGDLTVEEGALLSTEIGGSFTIIGNTEIAGTVEAVAGTIRIQGRDNDGTIHVGDTGRLIARGSSLITHRESMPGGQERVDGRVLNGGSILLAASSVTVDKGAVLDVSGAAEWLNVPNGVDGGASRTLVASNGGSIQINANAMDIDGGTFLGKAGGAGARGGSFSVTFDADYSLPTPNDQPRPSGADVYGAFGWYFDSGYIVDKDGKQVTQFFGTDLSTIDWLGSIGVDLNFEPGYTIESVEAFNAMLRLYDLPGVGAPSMLVVGDSDIALPEAPEIAAPPQALVDLLGSLASYTFYEPGARLGQVARLSPGNIAAGGFSELHLSSSPAIAFAGDVNLGGVTADGAPMFDKISISTNRILGLAGADVTLSAGLVNLDGAQSAAQVDHGLYNFALEVYGLNSAQDDTRISISADRMLQIGGAQFGGFSDTRLLSGGDMRLTGGNRTPGPLYMQGLLTSPGKLTLQADQIYAATIRDFLIQSDRMVEVLAPQDGPLNGTPYEAAAILTVKAPVIRQGGILRSPHGTINLIGVDNGTDGAGSVTLLPGSITSVSGDGRIVPYGALVNGDTWLDPIAQNGSDPELRFIPAKTVNIEGKTVDMQEGSLVDLSGGGDLMASEFIPGVGGTRNWLTGYFNSDYEWVDAPNEVFAVLPDYQGDIAPIGLGGERGIGVGEKIYLSGGSGLKAGFYTLLPAEFALLPGAYRVTAKHQYKGNYADMALGESGMLADGSSIQAGYRFNADTPFRDQRTTGFMVMPRDTLGLRSQYTVVGANTFYRSEAFLKKALRTNRPIGDLPRISIDGGSLVLSAENSLNLEGSLNSAAATGGRGGLTDILGDRIAVIGADTDTAAYAGYLLLDSDKLSALGAESLLIGGVRRQGATELEAVVQAKDVVVDNSGSVLVGPELLFAATGRVLVEEGSKLEAKGTIAGTADNLRMVTAYTRLMDTKGTPDTYDDVLIHEAMDAGGLLRLSTNGQINILRDPAAIDRAAALFANPGALADLNARRALLGQEAIVPGGDVTVANGASLTSAKSITLDATRNTVLEAGSSLSMTQISASASQVSIGAAPAATPGLVLGDGSLAALGQAQDIQLKSYSSIDFYGDVDLDATGSLTLDARQWRAMTGSGQEVRVAAGALTVANYDGGESVATNGAAALTMAGDNIYFAGSDKWLAGFGSVAIMADQRVIGQDDGTVFLPGSLDVRAGAVTAESGARLFFDAQGDLSVGAGGSGAALPDFNTFGATIGLTGASLRSAGSIILTGGTVNLGARTGNLELAAGSVIDVTSDQAQIFDATIGVGAGSISLSADRGDVLIGEGSLVNVAGTTAGGDAGTLRIEAALGEVSLNGELRGTAAAGARSGSFVLSTRQLSDFEGFNARLDAAGFLQSRSFQVNQGDLDITGLVQVREFTAIANDGAVNLIGTVETLGDNGGRIQLSAARDVNLLAGGQLLARGRNGGSGGTVLIETLGRDGGSITAEAGSLIDVSGQGPGGRLVRFRAPQIGDDVGIDRLDGTVTGARTVTAEAFRAYEGIETIDQGVIDTVTADAAAFMANAAAIRTRLGSDVTIAPGIELRSDGDMELVTDWDLHETRFDGAAGVLTLRAAGDILLNANLSDGFDGSTPTATLLDGQSWTFNVTAGANLDSPNSLAVLAPSLIADGKGSLVIGGTPDTTEYFYDPDHDNENRLYLLDQFGRFVRDSNAEPFNYHIGWVELDRDEATGKYINPLTGQLIEKDPVTGDYADTATYARRPLPYIWFDNGGGYEQERADGHIGYVYDWEPGFNRRDYIQWDNSTGYLMRTGTGAINIATGKNLVFEERPSVIYTAGEKAAPIADYFAPPTLNYGVNGGDILIDAQASILSDRVRQHPNAWLLRGGTFNPDGTFAVGGDRPYDQTTWWVNFAAFQSGIGALGGGNISIAAGENIENINVNIPTIGRVSGGYAGGTAAVLHVDGGGDLSLRAGGNILGGNVLVQDGTGEITAGGGLLAGAKIAEYNGQANDGAQLCGGTYQCYIHLSREALSNYYDSYLTLYTSTGNFRIQSGGDLNVDAVLDPLMAVSPYGAIGWMSYTPDARVDLFSAGGDVNIWNNSKNIALTRWDGSIPNPWYFPNPTTRGGGAAFYIETELWPGNLRAVAPTGSINVLGGLLMAPAPRGNLELIAGVDVAIGYGRNMTDAGNAYYGEASNNWRSQTLGIFMSQAKVLNTVLDRPGFNMERGAFLGAGIGVGWSRLLGPDLHLGDLTPARIYAGSGDVITTAGIDLPKALKVEAGDAIYFPTYDIQHNQTSDISLMRSGGGIYFGNGTVNITGPGLLDIQSGYDLWIPGNTTGNGQGRETGITSRPTVLDMNQWTSGGGEIWKPDEKAADISIMVGLNQNPDYAAFENAYFGLEPSVFDYVMKDAGGGKNMAMYLFDRIVSRGDVPVTQELVNEDLNKGFVNFIRGLQGLEPLESVEDQQAYVGQAWAYWQAMPESEAKETAFGAFFPQGPSTRLAENYLPERHQGLVNYVRQRQGLDPLETQEEQLAYLDTAMAAWAAMGQDEKTPFFRSVFFLELRTTGREANDPDSSRYDTTFRGYDAIKTLFPGAQKRLTEDLVEGESRWGGSFESYSGRVLSTGGGQIDVLVPGGQLRLSDVTAPPVATGQPADGDTRGDATRAGLVTTEGGGINVFTHASIILNQSRMLTAKGGNILNWSSYGDIAAGKGAQTSIAPTLYNYVTDLWYDVDREPAGLPTGAGIGTLASVPGAPIADVDLIAPNGIVDAGDAGIRVSGNFNVFAVQILGTDNIDVAGIVTGLPTLPSAPLNMVTPTETDAQSRAVAAAISDAVESVRKASAIVSPSIIEVRVTGYGEDVPAATSRRREERENDSVGAAVSPVTAPVREANLQLASNKYSFNISAPSLTEGVVAVGRLSKSNVIYSERDLANLPAQPVKGSMTTEDALKALVKGHDIKVRKVGDNSFVLNTVRQN